MSRSGGKVCGRVWGGWGGVEHVATMSNLNPSYLKLLLVELSQVELGMGFDNFVFLSGKLDIADVASPPPP